MSHISVSSSGVNLTSFQAVYVRVSKIFNDREGALSSAGSHVSKDDIKSPVCPIFNEVHDGNNKTNKIVRKEQVSDYLFSRPKMTKSRRVIWSTHRYWTTILVPRGRFSHHLLGPISFPTMNMSTGYTRRDFL